MAFKAFIKRLPIFRDLAHTVSPFHSGSVLENRLGLQVFRVTLDQGARALRRAPAFNHDQSYLAAIQNDGIVSIPDFMPAEQWAAVRAEYEEARKGFVFKPYAPADNAAMMAARFSLTDHPAQFPKTLEYLGCDPLVLDLASAALKRDLSKAQPTLDYLVMRNDAQTGVDDDIENLLHADVHYATVKCFFYLTETTQENGAFIFAPGTHRCSLPRHKFEYEMSVRQAKLKRGDDDIPPELLAQRNKLVRNILSEKQRQEMNIQEKQYCGQANSLLVANTMGFHRRGEFKPNQERALIIVNFRWSAPSFLRRLVRQQA